MTHYADEKEEEPKINPFVNNVKLYGKWSFDDVKVADESLKDHISLEPRWYPHTAGRWQKKRFKKIHCPIVERLVNCLMMHGRNSGKKLKACTIIKQTLELIHTLKPTDEETGAKLNPLQILITALENGGPREDSTRVGSSGVVRRQAVDVSPLRRINQAMATIVAGARRNAFRNIKTLPECLADEIILCASNSPNSYAIKKKTEIERVAQSNR